MNLLLFNIPPFIHFFEFAALLLFAANDWLQNKQLAFNSRNDEWPMKLKLIMAKERSEWQGAKKLCWIEMNGWF